VNKEHLGRWIRSRDKKTKIKIYRSVQRPEKKVQNEKITNSKAEAIARTSLEVAEVILENVTLKKSVFRFMIVRGRERRKDEHQKEDIDKGTYWEENLHLLGNTKTSCLKREREGVGPYCVQIGHSIAQERRIAGKKKQPIPGKVKQRRKEYRRYILRNLKRLLQVHEPTPFRHLEEE